MDIKVSINAHGNLKKYIGMLYVFLFPLSSTLPLLLLLLRLLLPVQISFAACLSITHKGTLWLLLVSRHVHLLKDTLCVQRATILPWSHCISFYFIHVICRNTLSDYSSNIIWPSIFQVRGIQHTPQTSRLLIKAFE